MEKTWKTENSSKISLSHWLSALNTLAYFLSVFFSLIYVYLASMVRVRSLESDCLNSNLGFTSGKVTFCPSIFLLVRNIPLLGIIVVPTLKDG